MKINMNKVIIGGLVVVSLGICVNGYMTRLENERMVQEEQLEIQRMEEEFERNLARMEREEKENPKIEEEVEEVREEDIIKDEEYINNYNRMCELYDNFVGVYKHDCKQYMADAHNDLENLHAKELKEFLYSIDTEGKLAELEKYMRWSATRPEDVYDYSEQIRNLRAEIDEMIK